jgi:hypothetical protein
MVSYLAIFLAACGYVVALTTAWVAGHAGYVLLASLSTGAAAFLLLDPVLRLVGMQIDRPATTRTLAVALSLIAGLSVFLVGAYR